MKKVFLGGTVNGSKWRSRFKEELMIDYFDPVVDDWNEAAYERELSELQDFGPIQTLKNYKQKIVGQGAPAFRLLMLNS